MKTYTKKEWLTLTVIPLELIIGNLIIYPLLKDSQTALLVSSLLMYFIAFLSVILLNKELLASQWQDFKKRLWLKLIIAIVGVVVATYLLSWTRSLIGLGGGIESLSMMAIYLPVLMGMLPTLFAPFVEEIVFRNLLFMKFKNSKLIFWLMFIIQSVLFGLVHWTNFNGDVVKMVPYMVIGAFFGLIYYFSKNIWQNILTHFIFNGMNFFMLLFGIIISLFR